MVTIIPGSLIGCTEEDIFGKREVGQTMEEKNLNDVRKTIDVLGQLRDELREALHSSDSNLSGESFFNYMLCGCEIGKALTAIEHNVEIAPKCNIDKGNNPRWKIVESGELSTE